jgi:hypothetical protein
LAKQEKGLACRPNLHSPQAEKNNLKSQIQSNKKRAITPAMTRFSSTL